MNLYILKDGEKEPTKLDWNPNFPIPRVGEKMILGKWWWTIADICWQTEPGKIGAACVLALKDKRYA